MKRARGPSRHSLEMRAFVLNYLREQRKRLPSAHVSVVDADFHDAFWQRFGGRFRPTNYGAEPVRKAMRVLRSMAADGLLVVRRVGLPGMGGRGFPTSVLCYELSPAALAATVGAVDTAAGAAEGGSR